MPWLLALGLLLLAAGAAAFLAARAARRRSGLPAGALRYSDTGRGEPPPALYSGRYGLAGRPDYLVQQGAQLIPVEVKSNRAPATPRQSHVLQLAAYCLLVEENYRRPDYGILRYADQAFRIEYTPALRQQVIAAVSEMRLLLARGEAPDAGPARARCRNCGYRDDCLNGYS